MRCYICLDEGVHTSGTGICAKCSQNACGRPPQRRDGQFHGELCAFAGCGRFFCEPHLHTHPHASRGVPGAFPVLSLVIAVAAAESAGELQQDVNPTEVLSARPEILAALNRYLRVISPGSTSLYEQRERVPAHTFDVVDRAHDLPVLWFTETFFTREVTATVARMALRTASVAAASIRSVRPARLAPRLAPWIEWMGEASTIASVTLDVPQTAWLAKTLDQVPHRDWAIADLAGLPDEGEPEELTRFLFSQRDHGDEVERVTAKVH